MISAVAVMIGGCATGADPADVPVGAPQLAGAGRRMCYLDDDVASCWGRWWDGDDEEVLLTAPTDIRFDEPVHSLALSVSHNYALTAGGEVARFDLEGALEPLTGLDIPPDPQHLAVSDDLLCVGGNDGYTDCWTMTDGAPGEKIVDEVAHPREGVAVSDAMLCSSSGCWEPGEQEDEILAWVVGDPHHVLRELNPGGEVVEIVATAGSGPHACLRSDVGHVICWGTNSAGQLGVADRNHRMAHEAGQVVVPASSLLTIGSHVTCSVAVEDGQVWCWGNWADGIPEESHDEPVRMTRTSGTTALAANWDGVCALTQRGVGCWGSVPDGQGGLTRTTRPVLVLEP